MPFDSVIVRRSAAAAALAFGLAAPGGFPATSAGTAAAQAPAPAVAVQEIGPRIGERVPGFTLRDQRGQPRTLESVMGPKGAMLVFFRSADW
jgi:cytochrome oxidase Cu insertion factor (SCO1/SenC/PrrC family)